jgi:hypothetical protein
MFTLVEITVLGGSLTKVNMRIVNTVFFFIEKQEKFQNCNINASQKLEKPSALEYKVL